MSLDEKCGEFVILAGIESRHVRTCISSFYCGSLCEIRLKAKLCKLKREILEPSGGGGGKAAGFEA